MTENIYSPKKPLNPVLKGLMLKTLRRTDVYVVENNDEDNLFFSSSVKNFHDETLN